MLATGDAQPHLHPPVRLCQRRLCVLDLLPQLVALPLDQLQGALHLLELGLQRLLVLEQLPGLPRLGLEPAQRRPRRPDAPRVLQRRRGAARPVEVGGGDGAAPVGLQDGGGALAADARVQLAGLWGWLPVVGCLVGGRFRLAEVV
jgi:hypothetical protein